MKPARLCRTAILAVAAYLVVAACSGSRPVPSEPPPKTPPAEPSVEKNPEARLVFSNCYLGNYELSGSSCQEGPSGGHRCPPPSEPTCIIGADCIDQQGVISPGDGSVYMDCKEGRCSCHLRAHTPPETVVEFEFAASCSSRDVMRQLMRDHCLVGMEVLPRSGESEEAPGDPVPEDKGPPNTPSIGGAPNAGAPKENLLPNGCPEGNPECHSFID